MSPRQRPNPEPQSTHSTLRVEVRNDRSIRTGTCSRNREDSESNENGHFILIIVGRTSQLHFYVTLGRKFRGMGHRTSHWTSITLRFSTILNDHLFLVPPGKELSKILRPW